MKLISILFFISQIASAQTYGLHFKSDNYKSKCENFLKLMASKPPEVQFGVHYDTYGNIFFGITSKPWFDLIFNSANDGIAIDIVTKDQYGCNSPAIQYKDGFHKGHLIEPRYLRDMKKSMTVAENGTVIVRYGEMEPHYLGKEIELNLVMVQNKNICFYNNFFDLKRYKWDMLDMGMYLDTLVSLNQLDSSNASKSNGFKTNYLSKSMKFTVPFDKNQVDYLPEDVKPIHDSLNYTDYYIKKIAIRAYSSVEGSEAKNNEIQNKRAESIVKALQTYQKPEIETKIIVAENWVSFLEDIAKTPFKWMENLSKAEIKEKLKDKKMFDQVETYLKNHRKAILVVELEKITLYKDATQQSIVTFFNNAIINKDIAKAKEIQLAIFDKIKGNELPIEVLDKLEMPKQIEYGELLNNSTIFRYAMEYDYLRTLRELEELRDLFLKNPKINYNIAVIKFRVWISGSPLVDKDKFWAEINNLKNFGIHPSLIKKMQINYNIIASELFMSAHRYDKKDACLKFILQNYQQTTMSENDLLNLAQYFASFAKTDVSASLIAPYLKRIDVNEDLLFYYLNLTIVNNNALKDYAYKKTILNAINLNRNRFCQLFDPYGKGGITFQLLDNAMLKKVYCENCEGENH